MDDYQAGNGEQIRYEESSSHRQAQSQHFHRHSPSSTIYQDQSAHYDPTMYQQQQPQQYLSYQSSDPWQQSSGFVQSYGGPSRSPRSAAQDMPPGYPPSSIQYEQRSPSSGSGRPTPPTPVGWPPGPQPYAQAQSTSSGAHVKIEEMARDRVGGGAASKRKGGAGNDGASAGPSKVGQNGGIEAPTSAAPSEFIKKLYKMLEDESLTFGKGFAPGQPRGAAAARGSVGWARGGISFVVWDMNTFTTKVLPQTFRHSNFSSFVRQLNKYGFSKIKHMDEDTGVIKENIWEFQHTHFQAGGKADLEYIKRKVVPSKKAETGTEATSPLAALPAEAASEDLSRLSAMENRVRGLEEHLARALDEVRQAKAREHGTTSLLREMLSHMMATERNSSTGSLDVYPSAHIRHMWQLFEQIAPGFPTTTYGYSNPAQRPNHHTGESSHSTDGMRRSQEGTTFSSDQANSSRRSGTQQSDEVPLAGYGTEHIGVAPGYADTPAWLTEGVTVPMSMYHRKNSEEMAYRLMMDALGTQGIGSRIGEGTDPLDTSTQQGNPSREDEIVQGGSQPIVQTSPFGTLLIPPNSSIQPIPKPKLKSKGSSRTKVKDTQATTEVSGSSFPRRKSSVIKPHWNKTPRILVVEDDMVYRQLSSKFLEKFGCIVETVENAHGAIAMINQTKYDLVLMDIFFGPDMDGRKATSLIRQFDRYTPIISMTSSAQPKDVDSYLQSGMNDILAKPFTKHGLFGILDKHLLHMKVLQLSAEVPRSVGVPPLSDQGVQEALAQGAAEASGLLNWGGTETRNPLAAMGWSDDTYQIVLNQFLQTGTMPDVSSFSFMNGQPTITDSISTSQILGPGSSSIGYLESNGNRSEGVKGNSNETIGVSEIFGELHARKRNLDEENAWSGSTEMPGQHQQGVLASSERGVQHEAKRAKR